MPVFSAQTTIKMDSGLPADSVTNTMHVLAFGAEGDIGNQVFNFHAALEQFYATALGPFHSPQMDTNGLETNYYALLDTPPRVPFRTFTWDLTNTNSNSLAMPPEVACVASFQATKESGVNQARRRNRIYLGPLNGASIVSATGQLSPTITAAVVSASAALKAAEVPPPATEGWEWVVYSPSDALAYPTANGWCDNAVDIQRRRGVQATTRTVWP